LADAGALASAIEAAAITAARISLILLALRSIELRLRCRTHPHPEERRAAARLEGCSRNLERCSGACFEAFPDFVRESIPDPVGDRLSA
jgi:hypothetical protein